MYEKALATNQRLKSRLESSKQELVMIQDQLQRAQVQYHTHCCQIEKELKVSSSHHYMYKCLYITYIPHIRARHLVIMLSERSVT